MMKSGSGLMLLLLVCSCQRTPTLTGEIDSIEKGSAVLIHLLSRDTIGRAQISAHEFTMSPEVQEDEITPAMLLCIQHDQQQSTAAPIAIEKGNTQIRIGKDGFPRYSGTPLQVSFSDFVQSVKDLEKQLIDQNTAANDSINNAIGNKMDDFYMQNRKSDLKVFASILVSDFITRKLIDPGHLKEVLHICASPADDDGNDARVCKAVSQYYEQWEGTPVRNFEGLLSDSTHFNLTDLAGKTPFIIDFWASWCGPCIKEMPELKRIYGEGNIEIIGVSIDASHRGWMNGITKLNLPWPNLRDESSEIAKLYNVTAVPTKFVVNRAGIIVARNPEDLRSVVDTLQ